MNEQYWYTFLQSQIACALIEVEAMKADNQQREMQGSSPCWNGDDFRRLWDTYGIHHNAAVTTLRQGQ